jgi:hypothetical protein
MVRSAKCGVRCSVCSAEFRVRLLSAENFSVVREHCHPVLSTDSKSVSEKTKPAKAG